MIRNGLILVLAILFIDVAGEGMVFPITPDLLQYLQGGTLQQATSLYGWSLTLYAALTLLFAPVWGVMSDRFGRKPFLVFSMGGAALGNLMTAVAPNVEIYFLGRIIAGLTSANIVVVNAYLIDSSSPEQRVRNFGLIGAVIGMGFVVGPGLGGLAGDFGLRIPFWIVAGLSALTFVIASVFLPESLSPENRKRSITWLQANPLGAIGALGRYPVVRSLAWTVLFNSLAIHMLIAVWVPYASYRYGFGPTENGLTLAASGLMTALAQALLVPYLVPKLGERRSIMFGLTASVATVIAYGLAGSGGVFVAIIMISSLAAIDEPAMQSLISKNVGDDEQGTVQGALASIGGVMGVVGPAVGTFLFVRFTGAEAITEMPGAPFFAGAIFMMLGLALAYRALYKHGVKS